MAKNKSITVETAIDAPVEKVWKIWNDPTHIIKWAHASDDWEAPAAENDLREGGKFMTRMAAKDGSTSFDFTGTYTKVVPNRLIEYTIDGGRKVSVKFLGKENKTKVSETFEAENENSLELQKAGWQAILENFKKCVESD